MKKGDQVAVISDIIKGRVLTVTGNHVLIEDEHGFERSFLKADLVVIKGDYKLADQQLAKDLQEKIKLQIQREKHPLKSFEIDLHIEELVESHEHMTNHEILTKQLTVCRSFIQNAIQKGSKRIVLIHGKGEGVLKSEIHLFLNKLRNFNGVSLEYHDAAYHEFGMGGATEVIFF